MERTIKIILSIFFLICLLNMPYGYYQLVRFLALFGFGILAYLYYQKGKQTEMIVYGALALLFQPFFKVALGRQLWNVVDIIVGIALLMSTLKKEKK